MEGGGDDGYKEVWAKGLGWSHLLHEVSTETQTICINKCALYQEQIKLETALKWHEDGKRFLRSQASMVCDWNDICVRQHTRANQTK